MATQGEIIEDVRSRLDEEQAVKFSDRELMRWINQAQQDISRRAECNRDVTTIAGVAGQTAYNLPNDATRIHIIEYADASGYSYGILDHVDRHNFNIRSSGNSSTPVVYTTWGQPGSVAGDFDLEVYPAPSDAGTFTVYYYSRPADLAIDGTAHDTELTLPAGWHDLVVDYVEMRALRKDRDNRWREAQEWYNENLLGLIEASIRYSDQGGQWGENPVFGAPSWLVGFDGMYF